ncbi:hypothetical protein FOL47_003986 [Perkinsus chesapeaki]|uniref:Uncharacterized protein n=1 Tax=Perkinsus chesapeaki TaxID=330153 RepID=A0A7J6MZC8_PERCH|nr:hypothetical protein FOL47_003986 [Perkinsus chesapeaki]
MLVDLYLLKMADNTDSTNRTAEDFRKDGNAKLKAKDVQGAIDSYTKAIDIKPEDHLAWSNRSAAYAVDGSYEKAFEDGMRCVELAPLWSKGHHRVGSALQAMGKYEEAVDHLDKAIASCTEGDIDNLKALRNACYTASVEKKLMGSWKGTVTEKLGGYSQVMQFEDGHKMHVMVMGQSQEASYMVDVSREPMLLNVHLAIDGTQGPNVPYIIRFTDDNTMDMCCPYLTPEIPTKFEGPGLVTMKKLPAGTKVDVSEGTWVDSPELEEIKKLDERSKVLRYMREFCDVLIKAKNSKDDDDDADLPQSSGATEEEIKANKQVLKMMSVNVKINAVEARYGSPVAQAAFLLVARCQVPKDDELEKASDELRNLMLEIGLIDEAGLEETKNKFQEANKFMQEQTAAASGMQAPSDGRAEATRARLQKKLESRQAEKATEESAPSQATSGKKSGKKRSSKKNKEEKAEVVEEETETEDNASTKEDTELVGEKEEDNSSSSIDYERVLTVGLMATAVVVGAIYLGRKYLHKKD